jgi:hypothetical protein
LKLISSLVKDYEVLIVYSLIEEFKVGPQTIPARESFLDPDIITITVGLDMCVQLPV